jgi:hypothetical protein
MASLIRLWARGRVVLGAILCVLGGLLALSGCLGFLIVTPGTAATTLLLRVARGRDDARGRRAAQPPCHRRPRALELLYHTLSW